MFLPAPTLEIGFCRAATIKFTVESIYACLTTQLLEKGEYVLLTIDRLNREGGKSRNWLFSPFMKMMSYAMDAIQSIKAFAKERVRIDGIDDRTQHPME